MSFREDTREVCMGCSGKQLPLDSEDSEGPLSHAPSSRYFSQKSHWGAIALISGVLLCVTYAGLSAGHLVPRPQELLRNTEETLWANNPGKCGGKLNLKDFAEYYMITASMNKPDDPASRSLHAHGDAVHVGMKSRAYFGDSCADGNFQQAEYMKVNWMGKRLSYTVDLSQVNCGCNAALYLVSMGYSEKVGGCSDYYCDAMSVCDVQCAEIDLMEANNRAWHTTLHDGIKPWDPKVGCGGAGYTVAGKQWLGPRDWSPEQYGPGAKCIDTYQPFEASLDFLVDEDHWKMKSINVFLTQGRCRLHASTEQFADIFPTLTKRLNEGMTLVISYWQDPGMTWLDGAGYDGQEFCKAAWEKDGKRECGPSVTFKDFKVTHLPRNYAAMRKALDSNVTMEWLDE
ncbi:unnamed protein product [Cladocopium goreaui]|uniref:cellulose 1,4-beta-cellobiosidase (non-reducing end) n=1 Tax=Cladocopium goreaui TaxID=2562237 RepID=A0A9P1FRV3_9DINO|nr:unnamed protein product [Cladocopium goreaui]